MTIQLFILPIRVKPLSKSPALGITVFSWTEFGMHTPRLTMRCIFHCATFRGSKCYFDHGVSLQGEDCKQQTEESPELSVPLHDCVLFRERNLITVCVSSVGTHGTQNQHRYVDDAVVYEKVYHRYLLILDMSLASCASKTGTDTDLCRVA